MRSAALALVLSGLPTIASAQSPTPPAPAPGVGRVEGRVVDEAGATLSYVDVSLEPEAGSMYSDSTLTEEEGSFVFRGVPVGSYRLSSYTEERKPKETIAHIVVTAGSVQSFTLVMVPEPRTFVEIACPAGPIRWACRTRHPVHDVGLVPRIGVRLDM